MNTNEVKRLEEQFGLEIKTVAKYSKGSTLLVVSQLNNYKVDCTFGLSEKTVSQDSSLKDLITILENDDYDVSNLAESELIGYIFSNSKTIENSEYGTLYYVFSDGFKVFSNTILIKED